MNKIEEALNKLFQTHRIIFWHDSKSELLDQYRDLVLERVEKLQVENNQFFIRHLVMKEKPTTKFLLYFNHKRPNNSDNWLLDLQLANYVFNTDQASMFVQELGLEYHFKELVDEHIEFFKSKERRARLKELLGEGDQHQAIRYKMLSVLFNCENVSLVTFIQAHASAFNNTNERYDRELERYNLKDFYWKEIARKYNYLNESPTIYDFLIEVFNNNFSLGKKSKIVNESKILLSVWKDTISYQVAFRELSYKIAVDTKLETTLNYANIDDILQDYLFELIDKRIISELVNLIFEDGLSANRLNQIIKQRENKYWYLDYENFYACLEYGMEIITMIRKYGSSKIDSFADGIKSYAQELYKIDYFYRKFIWHYRKAKQNKVLQPLLEKVEKVYGNDWLLSYNNQWQVVVDQLDTWTTSSKTSQTRFFVDHVKPFISKGQRLFVIISDGLRYECGWEYLQQIQNEKRYEGEIEYMVASLPSYTQLGMASLLPHKEISIKPDSDSILIEGGSTQGTQARSKILEQYAGVNATAINAEDFMAMNSSTNGREFVKKFNLIYIFHNHIDKVGDDRVSEQGVFEAVEKEIGYLMDIIKKIANMNGNNMFITADHGFLYQNHELDVSDFSIGEIKGNKWKESRRYVIGKNLSGDSSTKHFTSEQLNLSGDAEVLIPKSVNRIRIKGAGSRYVHGGASLQEIAIPLIKVTKKRQDTTKQVNIDIIKSTDKITTNILAVSFLQTELVSEKVLSRSIRSGIYSDSGELLSDQFTYRFDITEGIERQREVKHRFQLSSKASGKYKNKRVNFIIYEQLKQQIK